MSADQLSTADATVNITVTRNENGPVFTSSIYEQTIVDTTPVGNSVLQVTASDRDQVHFLVKFFKKISKILQMTLFEILR